MEAGTGAREKRPRYYEITKLSACNEAYTGTNKDVGTGKETNGRRPLSQNVLTFRKVDAMNWIRQLVYV